MKYLFIILMCFGLSGCSLFKGQISSDSSCKIIEVLLNINSVNTILGLKRANNVYPYIRIIDLTDKLTDCTSFHRIDSSSLLIPYFTESKLKTDLNTGHFRDLIILSISKKKNGIEVIISAATFETFSNKNTVYQIELSLKKSKDRNQYELLDEKVIEWKAQTPSVNYNGIK